MLSARSALRLIFLMGLLATAGSLYISYFGDPRLNLQSGDLFNTLNGIPACTICRFIRTCVFPIFLISGGALLRNDMNSRFSIFLLSLVGFPFSLYLYGIEMTRWTKSSELCGINTMVDCGKSLMYGGRFTLALAGIAFFIITGALSLYIKNKNNG